MSLNQKEYLTVAQAAVKLGVVVTRVRVWIRENRIKHIKIGDRYFIARKDCKKPEAQTSWSSAESQKKLAARAKQRAKRQNKTTTTPKGK